MKKELPFLSLMDAIITLSCGENSTRRLSERCRERVKSALSLYQNDPSTFLVMTGGFITPGNPSDAQLMREHAVKEGIPSSSIYVDEQSLDTIGNALFTKMNVIIPQGWNDLTIVTHESHMRRVQEIFSFVYGDAYNLFYEQVPHTIPPKREERGREQTSLSLFYDLFKHIPAGDHGAMLEKLLDGNHPCYKKRK